MCQVGDATLRSELVEVVVAIVADQQVPIGIEGQSNGANVKETIVWETAGEGRDAVPGGSRPQSDMAERSAEATRIDEIDRGTARDGQAIREVGGRIGHGFGDEVGRGELYLPSRVGGCGRLRDLGTPVALRNGDHLARGRVALRVLQRHGDRSRAA